MVHAQWVHGTLPWLLFLLIISSPGHRIGYLKSLLDNLENLEINSLYLPVTPAKKIKTVKQMYYPPWLSLSLFLSLSLSLSLCLCVCVCVCVCVRAWYHFILLIHQSKMYTYGLKHFSKISALFTVFHRSLKLFTQSSFTIQNCDLR